MGLMSQGGRDSCATLSKTGFQIWYRVLGYPGPSGAKLPRENCSSINMLRVHTQGWKEGREWHHPGRKARTRAVGSKEGKGKKGLRALHTDHRRGYIWEKGASDSAAGRKHSYCDVKRQTSWH